MAHSPTQDWMKTVEGQLAEGKKQFAAFGKTLDDNTKTTKEIAEQLEQNTEATKAIAKKLDDHVTAYEEFTRHAQPAIDAIVTMQAGVRIIGKIGTGIGWIATKVRKSIVWVAPILGFFATLWAIFHDNWKEVVKAVQELYK